MSGTKITTSAPAAINAPPQEVKRAVRIVFLKTRNVPERSVPLCQRRSCKKATAKPAKVKPHYMLGAKPRAYACNAGKGHRSGKVYAVAYARTKPGVRPRSTAEKSGKERTVKDVSMMYAISVTARRFPGSAFVRNALSERSKTSAVQDKKSSGIVTRGDKKERGYVQGQGYRHNQKMQKG